MKLLFILLVVLGTIKLSADSLPQWQNLAEIDLWLQSKDHLEVVEYGKVMDCVEKMWLEKRLGEGDFQVTISVAEDLMLRRFVELVNAKEFLKVCEFFEAYPGHYIVKGMMMDALAKCEDVEFSARVVHNAMGKGRWDLSRARDFNYPLDTSRRKILEKIFGGSSSMEAVCSEIGDESLDAQEMIKAAIEEKWPRIVEQNSSAIKNNLPHQNVEQDIVNQKSTEDIFFYGLPESLSRGSGWLAPAGLIFCALAIGIVLVIVICRQYSKR